MDPLHPACINLSKHDYIEDFAVFQEAEMMGYNVPRKCKDCANCQQCSLQEEGMTVKEFLELQRMKDSIQLDKERKKIVVTYPICGDITKFKDNRHQAIKRADDLRRSLKKRGLLEPYNVQTRDYVSRGVWEETNADQINKWKTGGGYVHYVCHHPIEKESSLSTKLRIVVDSSVKNCYNGPKLSSLYCKGPNYINSLFKVLCLWRSHLECAVADITKAYHSMLTTDAEFFMRLVVWKEEDDEEYKTYGHRVCGMGDTPSSVFLELSKMIAADIAKGVDPILAVQLVLMSYVDDNLLGGTLEQVMKMRGEVSEDSDGKLLFSGTLSQVMAEIGMSIKNICISGETDERILAKQGKVLGLQWNPTEDTLSFKLSANVTPRKGQGRLGPDLTRDDLDKLDSIIFTKRIAVSVASYNFDPLGLISCFLVKFKINLKDIVARDHGWDTPLEDDLQKKWRELLREILLADELHFPRSVRHPEAKGRPELVIYADGSTAAFGCVAYFRWNLIVPGLYHTVLLNSKSRVTPRTGMTPPRSEIQGLVVAVRLATQIIKYNDMKPVRVTIATDSQCSVAACDLNANSLAVFFGNRVIEIVTTMQSWGLSDDTISALDELSSETLRHLGDDNVLVDLIQHTPGEMNPADWPTRGNVSWSELGPGSIWQNGPPYLHSPRSQWPFSRDFVTTVPIEERRKKFMDSTEKATADLLVHHVTVTEDKPELWTTHPFITKAQYVMTIRDSFIRVRQIMARVIRMFRTKDGSEYSEYYSAFKSSPELTQLSEKERTAKVLDEDPAVSEADLQEAEYLFQLASWPDLEKDLEKKGNLDSLGLFWRDGVARMTGRLAPSDMMKTMGYDSLVVLSPRSRLAYLILLMAHREDHRASPGDALLRSRRRGYWVMRGRNLAKKVISDCGWCSTHYPTFVKQKMADLPKEIFQIPVRAFTNVCLDYTGAVTIIDQVKRRVSAKCWPVLFSCMNSGALHIQLATDYSTQGFLTQWIQFCSIRGTPRYVHTDMGSQLIAAGKQLKVQDGDLPYFNWKEIRAATSPHGTEFHHCLTQSQWRNGRAESAVRALKKTMKHLHKGNSLTYAEFSSLLSLAADRINERPLGCRHHGGAEGDVCVITPNLLIQGGRGCAGVAHEDSFRSHMGQISLRLKLIESAFISWWARWFDVVWESLVPIQKWRQEHRNVSVGDIVLVKYDNAMKEPQFRRGRVVEVHPDEHGVVRDVSVLTRSRSGREKPGEYKKKKMDKQRLPVQRLAVLLPVEEIANLEPAHPNLHFCTEDSRLPDASQCASPLSPSLVPQSPSPPHLGPTSDLAPPGVTGQPEDSDLAPPGVTGQTEDSYTFLRSLNAIAIHSLDNDNSDKSYLCWECGVRDQFYFAKA